MRKIFFILLINLFVTTGLAQEKKESCGQSSLLSEEIAKNVADDSRCFELRFYTTEPAVNGKGGVNDLHQRFREKQTYLLEKHGAELIAFWQRLDNPNTIVWLLAFKDRSHRDEVFTTFRSDPEWLELREKYSVPVNRELFFMNATDYSALKQISLYKMGYVLKVYGLFSGSSALDSSAHPDKSECLHCTCIHTILDKRLQLWRAAMA